MKLLLTATMLSLASGPFGCCVARGEVAQATAAMIGPARAAVQRSLPYLEKVGTAWMTEKKCNSCHVVTFLVWSHHEALAHGLDVDRKKLTEWVRWSLADSLSDRHWFRLRPQAMVNLRDGGMADEQLAKLKKLKSGNFTTKEEFLTALEKALGKEDLEKHREQLLHEGALPNNGGGPDTLAQLLLGRGSLTENGVDADSYRAIQSLLLEWQEPGGSWLAQGQLPGLKWDEKEMNDATNMWSILAVSAATPENEAPARSRQRALETLKNAEPGITLQSLALHLIIAHQFGAPARADAMMKKLFERQNPDGGWSWVAENKTSDAFSTGQALYALGKSGRDGNDESVRRAWEFLLRSQAADGSWEVPQAAINQKPRKLNVYPFWGTAWAAIGMCNTFPSETSSAAVR